MNKLLASTLISIGLTTAIVPLAMAQTATPPAAPSAQQPGPRHQAQRPFKLPSERVEARLDYLWKELGITRAQEPQWNAFADTLRKQATAMDKQIEAHRAQMAQRTERTRPSAIAQLERQQQLQTAALANLNERLAVQKPLYAALTDEQKQVADKVLAPRHGHGGGFNHRGRHRLS